MSVGHGWTAIVILRVATVEPGLDADRAANLQCRCRMDNAALNWLGSGTCRFLMGVHLGMESCYSVDGRGTIGLIAMLVLICAGIVVVWRRFL